MKLLTIIIMVIVTNGYELPSTKSFVNKNILDEIKLKANTWTPFELK